ncbi:MAG: hypothetical protein ACHQM6_06530, partial [Candidatus Kapaibacterium sp.]
MTLPTLAKFFTIGFLLVLVASPAPCQKQNNIWEFGDSLGIDFNSGKPLLLLDGVLQYPGFFTLANPGSGVGSIADRNTGKLLFYCSGHRGVFNRKHQLMGTPPDSSSTETVIIVPMGCDTNKYVICSNDDGWQTDQQHYNYDGPPIIAYSIVDMTQDNGYGAVVTSPYELLRGSSDRLTALPHANGTDSW